MLLDYTRIIGRAAYVRHKAKMLDAKPPFSIRRIMEVAFPAIHVTGAKLPDGVVEMCERRGNRRTIFYNRKYSPATQRVGIAHALFHLIGDMKNGTGMAECNVALRELERNGAVPTDPVEISCDLFAAELLAPFDALDRHAPSLLFPHGPNDKRAFDDEVDHLASRFNLPRGFMLWRLYDLAQLRKTHLNLK